MDNTNLTVQTLQDGTAPLDDLFTVTSIDNTSQIVRIHINGTNDAPTAATLANVSANEYQVINGFNGQGDQALNFSVSEALVLTGITDADDIFIPGTSHHLANITAAGMTVTQSLGNLNFNVTDAAAINTKNSGPATVFNFTADVVDSHGGVLSGQHFTFTVNHQDVINGTNSSNNVDNTSSLYGGFDTVDLGER